MKLRSMFQFWFEHPIDKTADVAVAVVGNYPEADIISIDVSQLARPELLKQLDIGIGDEVFATGLFLPAAGSSQNLPILRHGNIAMMPTEQIQTELGYADIYLVEARSIGGLSGSPVFVRPTFRVKLKGDQYQGRIETMDCFVPGPGAILLGLMHGHWDIKESEINAAHFEQDRKRGVNLGIGMVVPATKILEVINGEDLKYMREEGERQFQRRMVPGTDSAKPKKSEEKPTFTQEDFNAALEKVSRKITPKK